MRNRAKARGIANGAEGHGKRVDAPRYLLRTRSREGCPEARENRTEHGIVCDHSPTSTQAEEGQRQWHTHTQYEAHVHQRLRPAVCAQEGGQKYTGSLLMRVCAPSCPAAKVAFNGKHVRRRAQPSRVATTASRMQVDSLVRAATNSRFSCSTPNGAEHS